MSEDVKFEDAENYSFGAKDKVTFREIVLEHLRKSTVFGSAEFRGGFWQDRIQKLQGITYKEHFYIGDAREEFSNAVDRLADLLFPHFDKKMIEEEENLNKELDDKQKECSDSKKIKNKDQYFRDEKVKNKAKLFRHLNSFLYRVKYLEAQEIEDK